MPAVPVCEKARVPLRKTGSMLAAHCWPPSPSGAPGFAAIIDCFDRPLYATRASIAISRKVRSIRRLAFRVERGKLVLSDTLRHLHAYFFMICRWGVFFHDLWIGCGSEARRLPPATAACYGVALACARLVQGANPPTCLGSSCSLPSPRTLPAGVRKPFLGFTATSPLLACY